MSEKNDLSLLKSQMEKWPADTSMEECVKRDNILHPYFKKHMSSVSFSAVLASLRNYTI